MNHYDYSDLGGIISKPVFLSGIPEELKQEQFFVWIEFMAAEWRQSLCKKAKFKYRKDKKSCSWSTLLAKWQKADFCLSLKKNV